VSDFYCGRVAPTPTGYLHAGHALTFRTAYERARAQAGRLILRIEDLDPARCRREYVDGVMDDLRWLGIAWDGEVVFQSARRERYLEVWRRLRDGRWIYPCRRSRRDVAKASMAPHGEEPVFPVEWRSDPDESGLYDEPAGVNWRFRVPDGERMEFVDANVGAFERVALKDFGDFVVWSRDDIPAYELAVVVDDIDAGITEVVRGVDLLTSSARQALIVRALSAERPGTFHTPLVVDEAGRRLAKRSGGWSVRELRERGMTPEDVVAFASLHLAGN
jgi:glutamyl-tRNA synthetase